MPQLIHCSERSDPEKEYHDQHFGQQDTTAGYTEAVLVDNILYISGSIGGGTVAEQLQRIYTDLGNILKAYSASYQNVVKETLFTTDIEAVKSNNGVRKAFYKGDFPPPPGYRFQGFSRPDPMRR